MTNLRAVLMDLADRLAGDLAAAGETKLGDFARSYVANFVRWLDEAPGLAGYIGHAGLVWEHDLPRAPLSRFRARVGRRGGYEVVSVIRVVGELFVVRVGTDLEAGRITTVPLIAIHPEDRDGAEAFRVRHPGAAIDLVFESVLKHEDPSPPTPPSVIFG